MIRSMINKKTKTTKKKNTGTKGKRILAIFLTAILLTGILTVGLLAKYRSHNQKQAELISSQFHVSSDYLAERDSSGQYPSYEITDWQDGFDIQLYNYEKENTALISDDVITYDVTLSDASKWTYTDTNNGKIEKSNEKQSQSIKIIPPQTAGESDSVTVTIKTLTPFTKTLSATFIMCGKSEPNYSIQDQNDGTVLLTIRSNGYNGNIEINWNSDKYAPDNTNSQMESWTGNSQKLIVQKNTTYELLFFKKTVDTIAEMSENGTRISLS